VTKTEDGIQFKVYSLSPIALGWTTASASNVKNTLYQTSSKKHSKSSSADTVTTSAQTQPQSTLAAETGDQTPIVPWILLSLAAAFYIIWNIRKMQMRKIIN
jgi:beta-lactamase regulating signal transducer with metallopeptidase domain